MDGFGALVRRGSAWWRFGKSRRSIHDAKPAWIWQIPRLLTEHGLFALADKGYDGLDHNPVLTPIKGKPGWQKEYHRFHARLRGPGERMFDQVCCAPERVTQIAKTIQVLNDHEHRSQ